jgi:hypothetical protein
LGDSEIEEEIEYWSNELLSPPPFEII